MTDCFCFNAPDDELRKDIMDVFEKHNISIVNEIDDIKIAMLLAFSILSDNMGVENNE